MRAFGAGPHAYHVDVVVRRDGEGAETEEHLVAAVERLMTTDDVAVPGPDGARSTYSYDADAPDGTIGIGFWIRSATPGTAVDRALEAVHTMLFELIGRPLPLWDIRVLPISGVLPRSN